MEVLKLANHTSPDVGSYCDTSYCLFLNLHLEIPTDIVNSPMQNGHKFKNDMNMHLGLQSNGSWWTLFNNDRNKSSRCQWGCLSWVHWQRRKMINPQNLVAQHSLLGNCFADLLPILYLMRTRVFSMSYASSHIGKGMLSPARNM